MWTRNAIFLSVFLFCGYLYIPNLFHCVTLFFKLNAYPVGPVYVDILVLAMAWFFLTLIVKDIIVFFFSYHVTPLGKL